MSATGSLLPAYPEALLLLEDSSKGLARLDTERVAAKVDLLDVRELGELGEVRLEVGLGVGLEVLADDREDLAVCRRHVDDD